MKQVTDLRRYASRSEALQSLGLQGFVSAAVRRFHGHPESALLRERRVTVLTQTGAAPPARRLEHVRPPG